jgi:hypothetical protein
MKAEVLADIEAGNVPTTVASFSELHDYVDANEYGGLCTDACPFDCGSDADADVVNEAQTTVSLWLRRGRQS